MFLNELFYFDLIQNLNNVNTYDDQSDTSILKKSDTRKTRLTLRQINRLRRMSELHLKEQEAELEFISRMYAPPPEQQPGGEMGGLPGL